MVPNSVNDTQDFMPIKYKAFIPCKLHPTQHPPVPDLQRLGFHHHQLEHLSVI